MLLFDREKRIISMTRIGEFTEEEIKKERAKKKKVGLPHVLETMKPYITNDVGNDPYYLSLRKEKFFLKIKSFIHYLFSLPSSGVTGD